MEAQIKVHRFWVERERVHRLQRLHRDTPSPPRPLRPARADAVGAVGGLVAAGRRDGRVEPDHHAGRAAEAGRGRRAHRPLRRPRQVPGTHHPHPPTHAFAGPRSFQMFCHCRSREPVLSASDVAPARRRCVGQAEAEADGRGPETGEEGGGGGGEGSGDADSVRAAGGRGRFYLESKPALGLIVFKGKTAPQRAWLERQGANGFLKAAQRGNRFKEMTLEKLSQVSRRPNRFWPGARFPIPRTAQSPSRACRPPPLPAALRRRPPPPPSARRCTRC
jgi:hypothetical protein